jgi:hypothetical protein
MVFAIAALLIHLTPAVQALPALAASTPAEVSNSTETNSLKVADNQEDSAAVSSVPAPSRTAHFNLATVSLTASTKEAPAASLNAVSLDKSQNSQSLSTVRIPESQPAKPIKIIPVEKAPPQRTWVMLSLVQHGAAAFDAYSTRDAVSKGAVEQDPIMRPFAHSPALYGAIQVGPVLLDILSRQMQRSQNSFVRHMWWLPQSVSTAGFIFSGVHNLNVSSRPVK